MEWGGGSMILRELFLQAWHDLKMNRGRTIMTMFGIIWGIATVIILVGWGVGFEWTYVAQSSKLGDKLMRVHTGRVSRGIGGYRAGRIIHLTEKDVLALKNCPDVEFVTPMINLYFLNIKYGSDFRSVYTHGVAPEFALVRNFKVAEGRFINQADLDEVRRVCFLGANVKEWLFGPYREAVGEEVKIKGIGFKVVGIAERKGEQWSVWDTVDDEKAFIPLSTARALFRRSEYFSGVFFQPRELIRHNECEQEVRRVLARLHRVDETDYEAININNYIREVIMFTNIGKNLQMFLGAAAVITLLIGGFGVMNIMLVSVRERTHEIGILRAVGAKRRHIFIQFLSEALLIVVSAGIIGILIGMTFCFFMSKLPLPSYFPAPKISSGVMLTAFIFMAVVGIISGTLPALYAARLNPVEALRYE
jgi:putative ABC transport system permease protein